jgi:hypothetical protein
MKPILLMQVYGEDTLWELWDCGNDRVMEVAIND